MCLSFCCYFLITIICFIWFTNIGGGGLRKSVAEAWKPVVEIFEERLQVLQAIIHEYHFFSSLLFLLLFLAGILEACS